MFVGREGAQPYLIERFLARKVGAAQLFADAADCADRQGALSWRLRTALSRAQSETIAKFVVIDMFAKACAGKSTKEVIADANRRHRA